MFIGPSANSSIFAFFVDGAGDLLHRSVVQPGLLLDPDYRSLEEVPRQSELLSRAAKAWPTNYSVRLSHCVSVFFDSLTLSVRHQRS